ncbi:MAG: hypothetical protein ABID54_14235 [Pseudomonadota bacterium]
MTLQQMIEEVYERAGEPSNLEPYTSSGDTTTFSLGTTGAGKILRALNRAQDRVVGYKSKGGYRVRFHDFFEFAYFNTVIREFQLSAANNSTFPYTITLATETDTPSTTADAYNGWVVEMTSGDADGDIRAILDYTAGLVATVQDDFSSDPAAADTCKLYKDFVRMLSSSHTLVGDNMAKPTRFFEILKITDLENKMELADAQRHKHYIEHLTTPGEPNEWYRYGDYIFFNGPVDTERWFRMEYYRLPAEFTTSSATTAESEIPAPWHEAIVLGALEWAFGWLGEPASKYSYKRDFEDYMQQSIGPTEVSIDRKNIFGSVRIK